MEKINEKKIFEVMNSWGHDNPGLEAYIVTEKRELYYYEKHIEFTSNVVEKDSTFIEREDIKLIRSLSEIEYQQILDFIKNNIVGKRFEDNIICDAGFTVTAEYNSEKYTIKNNVENLYKPAYELIKSMLDNIKE